MSAVSKKLPKLDRRGESNVNGIPAPGGTVMVTDHEMRMEALRLFEENGRLREDIQRLLVAGNHIATYRSDRWPNYPLDGLTRDQQCEHALRLLGAGRDYDMWCCWSAMMQVRDSLPSGNGT